MRWANFIHIYQPTNQAPDILEQVVNQSYRRVFRGLKDIPSAKLTLNISGALSELLVKNGYQDVIDDIRALAESGRLEFTGTAKYHAFLPYIPADEIERQVRLNDETNRAIFGASYAPRYFFPPEMAIDPKTAEVIAGLGYQGVILDEISYNGRVEAVPYDRAMTIATGKGDLVAVFRDRRLSNVIISAVVRTAEAFHSAFGDEMRKERYLVTAMDGETFGHHRPGLELLLFELMKATDVEHVFVSDLGKMYPPKDSFIPVPSTWASSEYDIEHKRQFHSWNDPDSVLHAKQWELYRLVLDTVRSAQNDSGYSRARLKLDPALASDQFFWASNRPWWSLEMIEVGAWLLTDAINELSAPFDGVKTKAQGLYSDIISLGFKWQREGTIRNESHEMREQVRIPFKERTLEQDKPEVYRAFIDLMRREMLKAAESRDYERAILWRDAIWKIETKNDIYDTMHATDMLRNQLPVGEIETLMDQYKADYKKIRGGQAEQRR
ncbi:MAG: hypothetical protein A3A33_02210 [Candidatus Yanofskybacteria bacterium RIFCSPLOWO2_01_FULL_49_25]|uniref:UVR domain-containing protein n=1 Tax=Candidatus Yanofskybacteria bacterium RIFCSPLOWO2_01_FULL_49_25 TaxID=1802701 RepID=A0A1F8GRV9_9BACT|nr:MAG: hypothetical protein A3A33_02210 [Candidatus Yanofskybacteria bacterium RIFCSPLOWO2_01_FULL_49_25]